MNRTIQGIRTVIKILVRILNTSERAKTKYVNKKVEVEVQFKILHKYVHFKDFIF